MAVPFLRWVSLLTPGPSLSMTAPAASDATRWAHVVLVVFVGALAACQIGKVAPALPVIRAELGIAMVGAGWIASVYTGTAVAFGLIAGALADRYGPRNTLAAGLLLIAVGSLAGSAMHALGPMIASRIIEGMGFTLIVVSAPGLIFTFTAPRHRGLAMGIWGLFMPLGVTTMLLLAPVMLGLWGWRPLWWLNAGLALAAMALLFGTGIGGGRRLVDPTRLWRDLAVTVRRPEPWIFSIAFGLFSIQFSPMTAWLPTFLMEVQARSPEAAGAMAAFVAMMHAPGAVMGGWLVGRGLPRWLVIAVAMVLMALTTLATYALGLPPLVAYGAAVLFSVAAGLIPTVILTAAPAMAPSMAQVGAFNGILVLGANVGTLAGPPGFAAVVSAFDTWGAGGLYLALIALAGVAAAMVIRGLERRAALRKGDAAAEAR